MTTAGPPVWFRDPGELIAAIPALLQFSPSESLVLLGFAASATGLSVRCVMRADLPPANGPLDEVSDQLSAAVIAQEIDRVVLVIIAEGAPGPELPHEALRRAVRRAFEEAHVEVAEVLWAPRIAPGLPWQSAVDPQRRGTLPDPSCSPAALAAVLLGAPIYASRAALAAQLAAGPESLLADRTARLAGLPAVDPASGVRLLYALLERIAADPTAELVVDEDMLVQAMHALSHQQVREIGLACTLTEWAGAAERLWTVLTRATPAPQVAHPASLLATALYLRGSGALAQVALDIALAADPDHPLAVPVRAGLDRAIPPEMFRRLLETSFEAVARDLAAAVGPSAR